MLLPLVFLSSSNVLSQDTIGNNYSDLSRFTLGVHYTNYNSGVSFPGFLNNPNSTSWIDMEPAKSFFLDYRIIDYKNHALHFGVFLNSFNHHFKAKTEVFDTMQENYISLETGPHNKLNIEKTRQIELYLNYSYLMKLSNKFYIDSGIGLSYESNNSFSFYENEMSLSTGPPDWIRYQSVYYSLYLIDDNFFRYHFNFSVGYKSLVGLFNFGIKYSIPMNDIAFLYGNTTFFDPGSNGENFEFYNFYRVSGRYLSFTLSYTPIKGLFKKNK